jgi:hypothetical protein
MRIKDIINESAVPPNDPILNDPNLYKLLNHYVGPSFIAWATENSPYNPSGRNLFQQAQAAAIKPIYNKIAAAIIPLAAQENPDINRILRIVDSQLSMMGGLPQDIKVRVAQQLAADAKTGWPMRPPTATSVSAPSQSAEPAPDTAQVSSL